MKQTHDGRWTPIALQVLTSFVYTAEVLPDHKSPYGRDCIASFVRRGFLVPIIEPPFYRLTANGRAIVDVALAQARTTADRLAPKGSRRPRAMEDIAAGDLVSINTQSGEVWETPFQTRGLVPPYHMHCIMPGDTYTEFAERVLSKMYAAVAPGATFKKFTDNLEWGNRYDIFKSLGACYHDDELLSRTQWKRLFDVVFARTDKLRNTPLTRAIYHELIQKRLDYRNLRRRGRYNNAQGFDGLFKIVLETLPHD